MSHIVKSFDGVVVWIIQYYDICRLKKCIINVEYL
jgi:hypothetical protein